MINNLPQYILWILDIFNKHDKEAFLVGGCVRDMLMHRPLHDYDITTDALPEEVIEIFQSYACKVIPTGIKHGTITLIIEREAVEITTYRIERDYLNHRTPSSVSFTQNLYDDLKRRDFTMNAIAYHPVIGILDPYHGCDDIKQRLIRCVGDPLHRFEEDALRILRAIRFEATLHFEMEEHTKKAICCSAHLLTYISKERIRDEFEKILLGNKKDTLQTLREYGVLSYILPGYESIYNYKQNTPWHIYDIFKHTDVALNHTEQSSIACKLAIIFHDLGKPVKEVFDTQGIAHYKGHAAISSEQAIVYMKVLKYDSAMIQRVKTLVLYHDYYLTENKAALRRYLMKFHNDIDFALEALSVQIADDMAKNMQLSQIKIDVIQRCIPMLKELAETEQLPSLKMLHISGNDLLALGYKGNIIGKILQDALQQIIDNPACNQKEKLITFIKEKYKP